MIHRNVEEGKQMSVVQPLDPEALYQACDPGQFSFETTAELDGEHDVIGQERAVEAVRFGIGIEHAGYNIYAMGQAGTGKRGLLERFFKQRAAQEPPPYDWCYVHNFETEHRPKVIRLPAGKGLEFREDMDHLGEQLRTSLVSAFESDEYRSRRQVIGQELQEAQEKSLEKLQEKAKELGIALMRTPAGLILAPLKDGEALSPEEFQNLPEEERKAVEANIESLQGELKELLQQVPGLQREIQEQVKELDREVINFAVGGLVEELRAKYSEHPEIVAHLSEIEKDVVENASSFLGPESIGDGGPENLIAMLAARARAEGQSVLRRYKVNLLVDHRQAQGAPVVYEDNPTYQNLIGRVEYSAQMGALVTDFSLIKPGALHQANGGYLILDARKLLQQPYAYEALKRALQSGQLKIESIGQMLSLISTVSLEPEPIPLDVKVALFGDRLIYYLLSQHDPDFDELFKVQADFEDEMDRTRENQGEFSRLIANLARENNLRPFDRSAVARVIEHSARMVGDAEKLTTQVREVANLLREANYWSGENGNGAVNAADVQRAIDSQEFRGGRLRESIQETILREIFLIATSGEVVGQVNGLSVIQLGHFAFGRPSRITARVRLGRGEVVDIEREVDLSGPIHSKGVLILSGFLGARYASETPLSLAASLVFEQSYSGVEGDSASSAELYALLSAIAEAPVKQSLAVTGAINQHGGVQAIGGVNEKIEGFFDICRARGLTGEHGVLIPAANKKHLMLRQDVIEAVRAGQFKIYPVEHVDQGIEILTGIPAGDLDENGQYPPDTINGRVQKRLQELVEKRKELDTAAQVEGAEEVKEG
jgi:lon-related putative ATP-dependent protease